jgi:hypothetical protein
MDSISQFGAWALKTAIAAAFWIVEKFKTGDFWAIGGTLATIVAAIFAYRQLRRTPQPPKPIPELRIWDHGDRYIEGYLTLHNHGATTATIDRIEVLKPRQCRIGWPEFAAPHHGRRFKEPIGYEVLLQVPPGQSAGVGMLIELPQKHYPPTRVAVRARLITQDRRRPIMIDCATTIIERAIKMPAINGIAGQPQKSI